jgi:transposase
VWFAELPPLEGTVNDYRLLCNELMRLMLARQLFTFVTAAAVVTPCGEAQPVAGTNNEAERTLRTTAQARKTGRTNKTFSGARRQTIVTSVLESLRQYLPSFTLSTVIAEILRWQRAKHSCFARLMAQLKLSLPDHSVPDLLLPVPAD